MFFMIIIIIVLVCSPLCASLSLFEKIVMLSLCSVGCFSVFPKYGFIIILYSFFSSSSFYHALDV